MGNLSRWYRNYARFSFMMLGTAALITAFTFLIVQCTHKGGAKPQQAEAPTIDYNQVAIPDFNADSAYRYAAEQPASATPVPKGTSSVHAIWPR